MTIDRTPAHLADVLRLLRELRMMPVAKTLQACLGLRIMNLAVERLLINLGEAAHFDRRRLA